MGSLTGLNRDVNLPVSPKATPGGELSANLGQLPMTQLLTMIMD